MKIIRILGLVTGIVGAASWIDARSARRRARRSERDAIEKTRWESEGGATPYGPHVSETTPGATTGSGTTGATPPG